MKYYVGQKIVVKVPKGAESYLNEGEVHVAEVVDTPWESSVFNTAIKIPGTITYSTIHNSIHLNYQDWIVIGELNHANHLLFKLNNLYGSFRRKYINPILCCFNCNRDSEG